jgi:two-component system cell cycle sensor histidine kinase/response regulator CckA
VLLVEDENVVRQLAARAFSTAGWQVLAAESGEAALELAETQTISPRVLVTDAVMPGLDGPSLAARLRQRWPGLPVLLVSGYIDERLRAAAEHAAIEVVSKPYRLAELLGRASELAAKTG